ncbi:MAG: NifU family protein [Synergistetes bacterium]|nr:NifU family protein [Synergistota bacterium]MCX8127299.1 NifU family protein [Synergistota bacterium]MDW8191815.1 NifU family protein [Synergistota bacterium]
MANLESKVREVLEKLVNPYLAMEGGKAELVGIEEDGTVKVKLAGQCGRCPFAQFTLKAMVESTIKKHVPEVTRVESV